VKRHWKQFLVMFTLSWLAGATMVTLVIAHYAAEDFSLLDLTPMYLILAVFGLLLASTVSLPVLLFLQRRFPNGKAALLYPLTNTLLVALLAATATGSGAFILKNLPIGEAVTFTGAFTMMGLAFSLAFLKLYGEGWTQHWMTTLVCIFLTVCAIAMTTFKLPFIEEALLSSAANGSVTRAITMSVPRSAHTATLLADGRVLLIGGMVSVRGEEVYTASTEIYDPKTGAIKSSRNMSAPRAGHTATRLADGNVLVTGGGNELGTLTTAELYRTTIGDFIPVGSMLAPRERHSATLLVDGRVLITGGTVTQPSKTADLYDPKSGTFSPAAPMHARRAAHSSTLLNDGRVLIAGGAESLESVLRSVETYDPATNSFTEAGQMQVSRYKHAAVLLEDGKILLLGGSDERDWSGRRISVEIYDPANNRSQIVGSMRRARFKFPNAVALAGNGNIIVSGGGRRVEIYGSANRFAVSGGSVEDEWFYATATSLPDDRVFIAGGYNSSLIPTRQAWLYQPPVESNQKLAHEIAINNQE